MMKSKEQLPDFDLQPVNDWSAYLIENGITTFKEAALYIAALSYGRPESGSDFLQILKEGKATCSGKHAILQSIAKAHGRDDIKLMTGIYRMKGSNTPGVEKVLNHYQLDHIPEAHCYLRYRDQIFDFTRTGSRPDKYENELLYEKEMDAATLHKEKPRLHKAFIKQWLQENPDIASFKAAVQPVYDAYPQYADYVKKINDVIATVK